MSADYAAGRSLTSSLSSLARYETRSENAMGVVTRIEADEVWVRLNDSEEETRAYRSAVDVSEGDSVSVTVTGGRLYVDSNYTRPSVGVVAESQVVESVTQQPPSGGESSDEIAALASSVQENAMKIGEIRDFLDKYFHKVEGQDEKAHLRVGASDVIVDLNTYLGTVSAPRLKDFLGSASRTITIDPSEFGIDEPQNIAAIVLNYRGTIVQLTLVNLSPALLSYLVENGKKISAGYDWEPVEAVYYDNGNFQMTLDTDGRLRFGLRDMSAFESQIDTVTTNDGETVVKVERNTINATVTYINRTYETLSGQDAPDAPPPPPAEVDLSGESGFPVDHEPPVNMGGEPDEEEPADGDEPADGEEPSEGDVPGEEPSDGEEQ